jgi:hypothetical protein
MIRLELHIFVGNDRVVLVEDRLQFLETGEWRALTVLVDDEPTPQLDTWRKMTTTVIEVGYLAAL